MYENEAANVLLLIGGKLINPPLMWYNSTIMTLSQWTRDAENTAQYFHYTFFCALIIICTRNAYVCTSLFLMTTCCYNNNNNCYRTSHDRLVKCKCQVTIMKKYNACDRFIITTEYRARVSVYNVYITYTHTFRHIIVIGVFTNVHVAINIMYYNVMNYIVCCSR